MWGSVRERLRGSGNRGYSGLNGAIVTCISLELAVRKVDPNLRRGKPTYSLSGCLDQNP
jgi:hypothetical protein